ncbi:Fasciclin-like repeat protein [Croceitalea dokdonensis DOKDO 023]|uniref:Fasciclin-like repeat protein n=1 Tax=Croceitalea dokdonensis DOKDO 023 TaxID=1300341 RepID=A0A0P7AZR1_9FLAO|nr:fasciclin domain-containing protein [Croceitalea dokdonensis]KPM32085.1 Fasciclin-like repeat protein [Croceitalea dokdonensis DOKDO 023]
MEEELLGLKPDFTLDDARSVLGILSGRTEFDTFHKSLKSAGMATKLDSIDELTVFAPTNEAFNRITEAKLANLQTPAGTDEMKHLLNYHLIVEEYDLETLISTIRLNENILRLKTLNGGYVALTLEDGKVFINDETGFQSKLTIFDLEAKNGVVHGIESVLLPQ